MTEVRGAREGFRYPWCFQCAIRRDSWVWRPGVPGGGGAAVGGVAEAGGAVWMGFRNDKIENVAFVSEEEGMVVRVEQMYRLFARQNCQTIILAPYRLWHMPLIGMLPKGSILNKFAVSMPRRLLCKRMIFVAAWIFWNTQAQILRSLLHHLPFLFSGRLNCEQMAV